MITQHDRRFYNLIYLEKAASVGGRFADFNLHDVTSTSDSNATFSHTVAELHRHVKRYENDFNGINLINQKGADTWLMQLGVQFPLRQPMYGSIGKIS